LKNPKKCLAPFGFRHEIAKRYTPLDWWKSVKVAKRIESDAADSVICAILEKKCPALIGRLGGTEARFLGEFEKLQRLKRIGIPIELASKFSPKWQKRKSEIFSNAGFYSNSWDEIEKFSQLYVDAFSETDVLGAWGVAFTWIEGKYLNWDNSRLIPVGHTAPWVDSYSETQHLTPKTPWSLELQGKKVLVISAFANSIAKQHRRIDRVFPDFNFPVFSLSVIRSPITAGQQDESGKTWFELLDEMKTQIDMQDFDVALIAAGAYSYPLAAYVKKVGKIGIHCGGGLQLYFGVMGNRWNNAPEVLKYLNSEWVRPSKDERPKTAMQIENACYW
jgi:hypothetical protein